MQEKQQLLLDALNSRYATKVFDPDNKIEDEKLQALLESIPLTPSAINAQPWHLFVVRNLQEKTRLAEAAMGYNQPKYINADSLFIFCAKTDFTLDDFVAVEEMVAKVRNKGVDEARITSMSGYIESMEAEDKKQWLQKQLYLMLGQFLTSCAILQVDSCPIEGFDPKHMDQLLNLSEKGLTAVVTVAVGYRAADDFNQLDRAAKARFPAEEVITLID